MHTQSLLGTSGIAFPPLLGPLLPQLPSPKASSPHTPEALAPLKLVVGNKRQAVSGWQGPQSEYQQARSLFSMHSPGNVHNASAQAGGAMEAVTPDANVAGTQRSHVAGQLAGAEGVKPFAWSPSAAAAQGHSTAAANIPSTAAAEAASAAAAEWPPAEEVALLQALSAQQQHEDDGEDGQQEHAAQRAGRQETEEEEPRVPRKPRSQPGVRRRRFQVAVPSGMPRFWHAPNQDTRLKQQLRSCYRQLLVNGMHTCLAVMCCNICCHRACMVCGIQ